MSLRLVRAPRDLQLGRVVFAIATLAAASCGGRTPLWDLPASASFPGARDAGAGQGLDGSARPADAREQDAPAITRDLGVDARGDAPASRDMGADGPVDAPALRDLGVDARGDRPASRDVGMDGRGDASVIDTRSGDTMPRPVLELIAGAWGGRGHQNGDLTLAKFAAPYAIASDSAGNLFVGEQRSEGATLRRIDVAAGLVTTLAGSINGVGAPDGTGAAARFRNIAGIVSDGRGNLFLTDDGASTIRKVVVATGVVTTLAGTDLYSGSQDGPGSTARFESPKGIAFDGAGNLFVADRDSCTIRKIVIATGVVTTVAGTTRAFGGEDGIGQAARFSSPWGVAADGTDNLYVTDSDNHTIRRMVISTGAVSTLAGSTGVSGHRDGTGQAAQFNRPQGIAYDGTGNLYVSEANGHTVRKVVIASGEVTTLAGAPGSSGSLDGKGSEARFSSPLGLAVGKDGELFVADYGNDVLRKLIPTTGVVTLYAGSHPRNGAVDGIGADARFDRPADLVSDGAGNLFVADTGNHTIRKIVVATGAVTTLAGTAGQKGTVDGMGAAARFWELNGMTSDQDGNLYVSDGHGLRRVRVDTGEVTTLAGDVEAGGRLDGFGRAARFSGPRGVLYDGAGVVFVAEYFSSAIRKVVVATGEVSTLACSTGIDAGAEGADESFINPRGLATDGAGHLFVTEARRTVRQVDLASGRVTTLAGSRSASSVPADGRGESARFRYLHGILSDGAGGLWIVDNGYLLRRIDIVTREVTTVLGDLEEFGLTLSPLRPVLGGVGGLAFGPPEQLFLTSMSQNVVLRIRF